LSIGWTRYSIFAILKIVRRFKDMSLSNEIIKFLDMPETIQTLSEEIQTIMATVNELKSKFEELKSTMADEAVELRAKFDELKATIKAKEGFIDPAELDAVTADIDSSIANLEALSDTANDLPAEEPAPTEPEVPSEPMPEEPAPTEEFPVEPTPEEPAPTEEVPAPTEPEMPVDENPAEPTPVDGGEETGTGINPNEGGTGSDEEPTF
jgi:hypothetical protein